MPKISSRTQKVSHSEYDIPQTKVKHCAYCKNHDEVHLEKNHKPFCKFNNAEHFSTCRPCNQNHKKTENVRRWREKQNMVRNDQNDIESVNMKDALGNLVNECFNEIDKKFVDEMLVTIGVPEEEKMEVEEAIDDTVQIQITPESSDLSSYFKDIGLTIAILPANYPENILTEETVNELQSFIEDMIDQLPSADQFPRFKSSIYECGYWRVSCVDEFTKDWFINYIATSTNFESIKFMSINQIQKHYFTANIPEKPLEITNILRMLHKQNNGLDTSRWEIVQAVEYEEGYRVMFEVDPMSYSLIKYSNHMLNFGMGQLEVTVIDEDKKSF